MEIDWDYARNADLWEHEEACRYVCPKDAAARAKLDRLAKVAAHGKKLHYVPIRRRRPFPDSYAYERPEFLAFAQSKSFTIPPELASIESPHPAGWPWGSYETKLLRDLAAAFEHWWKDYDLSHPERAPINKDVAAWLVKERGVAKEVAESMAKILRAEGLPKGPRKQQ